MKRCSRCGQEKPPTDFYRRMDATSRELRCKDCSDDTNYSDFNLSAWGAPTRPDPAPISNLILEVVKATSWARDAACRDTDPEVFWPTIGAATTEAREICATCPVKNQCLEFGMDERHGIWGGTSERERREIRKRRKAA